MTSLVNITTGNFDQFQDDILKIEKSSFLSPWSQNAFMEELAREVSCLRALIIDGEVSAYICFWMFAGEIHVMNIAVHPKRRRQGLGRYLLSKMLEEGNSKGVKEAWLEGRPSNFIARLLYQKMGFTETYRRPRYYRDTNEDAIVMSLSMFQDGSNPLQIEEWPRFQHMC